MSYRPSAPPAPLLGWYWAPARHGGTMEKQSTTRGRVVEEMGRTSVGQVLEMIRELDTDELREVRQAVDAQLGQQGEASGREAFRRALLEAGLVQEFKAPPIRPAEERPLVPIQGKPLSETIIEERR